MLNATEAFAKAAQGAEGAVFYYSGHGVQVGEDNYLLPSDAPRLTGISVLKNRTVLLRDTVMVALEEAGARNKVIILDCCRDNPFAAQLETALAQVGKSVRTKSVGEISGYGPGFYLAFATSPGTTADDGNGHRNSPFTAALLRSLPTSASKDIDFFFRDVKKLLGQEQVSWTNHSLNDSFALAAASMAKTLPAPPAAEMLPPLAPAPSPSVMPTASLPLPALPPGKELQHATAKEEVAAARKARNAENISEALDHLRIADLRVPNHPEILAEMALTYEAMGLKVKARSYWTQVSALGEAESGGYHQLAVSKLLLAEAISSGTHSYSHMLPERGYFDSREVFLGTAYAAYNSHSRRIVIRRAQSRLKETAHYRGIVDGDMGPTTQKAILDWQKLHGLEVTGRLDHKTQVSLQLTQIPESTPPASSRPAASTSSPSVPAPTPTATPAPSTKSGKPEAARLSDMKKKISL
ncbi:MAG: caspase family protein, partial [Verrucomicrobium sp.]|nr:caspase family protein [Verrucomicrobium sp.]